MSDGIYITIYRMIAKPRKTFYEIFHPFSFTTDTYKYTYTVNQVSRPYRPVRKFEDRCTQCFLSYCFAVALFSESERKGSCVNKFSSIHRLHLARQGLLFCVPQRHSASQLPHLHTYIPHTHLFIYIQEEF